MIFAPKHHNLDVHGRDVAKDGYMLRTRRGIGATLRLLTSGGPNTQGEISMEILVRWTKARNGRSKHPEWRVDGY
jgi:hypothetical protein